MAAKDYLESAYRWDVAVGNITNLSKSATVSNDSVSDMWRDVLEMLKDKHPGSLVKIKETNKKSMNSLVKKMKMATMPEPQKTLVKAGVVDMEGNLTGSGTDVLLNFLLAKYADELKNEVASLIEEK